jgi:hypothetical protein
MRVSSQARAASHTPCRLRGFSLDYRRIRPLSSNGECQFKYYTGQINGFFQIIGTMQGAWDALERSGQHFERRSLRHAEHAV